MVAAIAIGLVMLLAVTRWSAIAWWRSFAGFRDDATDSPSISSQSCRLIASAIRIIPREQAGILLADGILAALWRAELENLELIGRAGMRPYAGREDVVSAVASDLDVDLLIEGSIRFASDDWQVDIRLMQVPPGRVVWSQTVAGDDPALPTGAVAAELVDQLADDWPEIRKELNSR